jgi:hypothetical protein
LSKRKDIIYTFVEKRKYIPLSKNNILKSMRFVHTIHFERFFTNPQVINLRLRRLMIGPPTRHRLMGSSRPTNQTRGLLQAHNSSYPLQMPNLESLILRAQFRSPNLEVGCFQCPITALSTINVHARCVINVHARY